MIAVPGPAGASRWTPGWVETCEETACLDLFEAAFGYRMDDKLWRWKYRGQPTLGMGVWQDGVLVAFYGAMPRPLMYFGRPRAGVQIGDVMVHPKERGVVTRRGPFQIAASTYRELSLGEGRPFHISFGFPTERALAVALRLGLYGIMDRMVELSWPSGRNTAGWTATSEPLTEAHAGAVAALWEAMSRGFQGSILGVRDWKHLSERYLEHPTQQYECIVVRGRLSRRPRAVLVFKRHGHEKLELMDIIAPPEAFAGLVRFARDYAARRQMPQLFCWATSSHAHLLTSTQPTLHPLDLAIPTNLTETGPPLEEAADKWWLMAGDTDFR